MKNLITKSFLFAFGCVIFFLMTMQPVKGIVELPEQTTTISNYTVSLPASASASELQEEIDKATLAGGGVVSLATGTYVLDHSIELKSNVTLQGQGSDSTILQRAYNCVIPNDKAVLYSTGNLTNAIVNDLMIDGNDDTTISTDAPENPTYGLLITDGNGKSNDKISFKSFKIQNAHMGFHVKGTYNLNVENCDFSYNGKKQSYYHNAYIRRVYKVRFYQTDFYNSTSGNGLNVSFSEDITLDHCNSHDNYFRGIRVASSSRLDIMSCNSYNNLTADGIIINSEDYGVTDFRVFRCKVWNNGQYGIQIHKSARKGQLWYNIDGGHNNSGYLLNSSSSYVSDTLIGDANSDRTISSIDSAIVLKKGNQLDQTICDTNGDVAIDVKDALNILYIASGMKEYFQ